MSFRFLSIPVVLFISACGSGELTEGEPAGDGDSSATEGTQDGMGSGDGSDVDSGDGAGEGSDGSGEGEGSSDGGPSDGGSGENGDGDSSDGTGGSDTGGGNDGTGGSGEGQSGPDPECVEMVGAADAFLNGLSDARRDRASFDWNSPQRSRFEFLPPLNNGAERDGLTMKDMTSQERALLETFLSEVLSQTGKDKVDDIRALETLLGDAPYRDSENYFIWFFGNPSTDNESPWGFRFEGHHLSLHASMVACQTYSATPTFWGASPNGSPFQAELAARDALWSALSGAEKTAAQSGSLAKRGEETKNGSPSRYADEGLSAGDLTLNQQQLLASLIHLYVDNMAAPIALERRDAIEAAGFDAITFVRQGEGFRIQGPTFLIEFQSPSANHYHSVWRDYDGDWGEDLIARHMAEHH